MTPAPAAGESETARQLEQAEREDAGRGLEFVWVDLEGGYQYVALQGLHSNGLLDGSALGDSGSGFALGAGAGVRVIFLTIGARFRLNQTSDWNLWTLGGEVGLHLPYGALEPSFTLGVGYAALANVGGDAAAGLDTGAIDVAGVDARLGANLDYYINPLLSFGARGSVEVLALWRSSSPQPEAVSAATAAVYGRDGSGIGIGVALSAVAGLHF